MKELPKKPFDIDNYQSPSLHESEQPYVGFGDGFLIVDGKINKDWSIAIAKALGVTGEDLK
tara:strand:- start:16388 stop:16570 length:183 start_codon:yes stop_codon:yes gene_type:complete